MWLLDVQSWTWFEMSVNNMMFAAPQLWSHPAVMVDETILVFAGPVKSTIRTAAASLMTRLQQALMHVYTLDCSELEAKHSCSWQPVMQNSKGIPASSLHSVNVTEDMIVIFGGLSDKQTVQTVNDSLVLVTSFWTD